MKVKRESEVAQSCLTLWDPMDCSLPGSSVHGIFQARVLEWGAIAFTSLKGTILVSSEKQVFHLWDRVWFKKKNKQRVKNVLGNLKMTTEIEYSKHFAADLEDTSWQTTSREQDKNWRHGESDVREDGAVRSTRNPSLSRQQLYGQKVHKVSYSGMQDTVLRISMSRGNLNC